jgi:hypothetical protein
MMTPKFQKGQRVRLIKPSFLGTCNDVAANFVGLEAVVEQVGRGHRIYQCNFVVFDEARYPHNLWWVADDEIEAACPLRDAVNKALE